MTRRLSTFAWLAASVTPALVAAQVTTSTLTGRITGTEDQAVPGVTVVATYVPTGARYGAVTADNGRYTLANLRVGGPYHVETRRIGYRPETRDGVFLALGTTQRLDFVLAAAATTLDAVTVTASTGSVFDRRRTGPQTNVDRRAIENLPSLSRSLQDMTRLTPQGNAGSFGGTNYRYNNITIDGAASNDVFSFSNSYGGVSGTGPQGTPGAGAKAQPISLDAIDQVQVVLAPFDVKLGNFTGASINAVTRSGTNEVDGSLYSFGRNQKLTGKSADDARTAIPNYTDYQYGGRIGGPIVRDKAFYFLNAEVARRNEPLQFAPGDPGTLLTSAQAQAISDTLRARLGSDAGSFGPYNVRANSTKLFGRADVTLSDINKLSLRHSYVGADAGQLTRGVRNINFGSQDFTQRNTTNSTVAELNTTLASGVANTLIASASFTRDRREPVGAILPQIEINGTGGSSIFLGTNREAAIFKINTNVFELTDNMTVTRGRNNITLGTHNEVYGIQYYFQNAWNGRWQYSSIANFNANRPSRIRGTYKLGDNSYGSVLNTPSADFRVIWPSGYVQDEITVTDRLRVTPGIRVDVPVMPNRPNPNPSFLATSYNGSQPFAKYTESNIGGNVYVAPRISFNYDVRGDQTLQLRGGSGVFTGRIPFAWLAYAYYNNGVRFNNVDCRPSATSGCAGNSATVPLVPGERLSTLQSGVYEMNLIDNHFKLPTVERSSFGVDYKPGGATTLTFEGSYTKSLQDVKFLNIGLKDTTGTSPIDGRPIFLGTATQLRVNPNVTSVFLLTNTRSGDRYSLTGQASQTIGGLRGSVAYTYGQSRDVSNGIRNSPQSNWEFNQVSDPRRPGLSQSNFDIRHRVVASLLYTAAWRQGWNTGASLFYSGVSGSPFTFTYVNDYNRDGSSNNDLLYVPKDEADARIVPAAGDTRTAHQIYEQFNSFIESQSGLRNHRGQIVPRNAGRTPWNHQIDLRVSQDIPFATLSSDRLQLTLDVINAGALLGEKFGRQYFVPNENNYNFPTLRVTQNASAAAGSAPTGFSFDPVKDNKPYQYDPLNSRYQAQLGARILF